MFSWSMAHRTWSALFADKISARCEGTTWETCCTMNTAAPKSAGRSETIVLSGRRLPADPPITTILTLPNSIFLLQEGRILSPRGPIPMIALLLFLHCVAYSCEGHLTSGPRSPTRHRARPFHRGTDRFDTRQ